MKYNKHIFNALTFCPRSRGWYLKCSMHSGLMEHGFQDICADSGQALQAVFVSNTDMELQINTGVINKIYQGFVDILWKAALWKVVYYSVNLAYRPTKRCVDLQLSTFSRLHKPLLVSYRALVSPSWSYLIMTDSFHCLFPTENVLWPYKKTKTFINCTYKINSLCSQNAKIAQIHPQRLKTETYLVWVMGVY